MGDVKVMLYRGADEADANRADLRELAMRGLRTMKFDGVVSQGNVDAVFEELRTGRHYAEVAEEDGKIVAYFAALIVPHLWFERSQMQVVGWYSEARGAGMELLRRAIRWMREQMGITLMVVTANPIGDRATAVMNRAMRQLGAEPLPTYILRG